MRLLIRFPPGRSLGQRPAPSFLPCATRVLRRSRPVSQPCCTSRRSEGSYFTAVARIDIHDDPGEALTAAEALRAKHGRDARSIACLARALLRAGRPKEGVGTAGEALHIAVLTDQLGVVTRLVQTFWDYKEDLALEPSVAIAIADHLDVEGQQSRAAYFRSGRMSLL